MAIRVGTAGWTDPSLIKSKLFYPKGCSSPEDRLRFYARNFPMVEVDSSYYALPSATNAALWVERTPADFVWTIKAFRLFTGHQTPANAFPRTSRRHSTPTLLARKSATSITRTFHRRSATSSGNDTSPACVRCIKPGAWPPCTSNLHPG